MDGTGDLFRPLLERLPSSFEPVVVSYPPDQHWSYAQLARHVRGLLPQNEPFAVLGESFSGPIAIQIASNRPANLRALILCCTFAKNPHPRFRAFRKMLRVFPIKNIPSFVSGFVLLGSESTPDRREEFEAVLGKVDPSVLRTRAQEILDVDVTDRLQEIEVPTIYIQAADDLVVPKSAAEHIRSHMPDLGVVETSGPHFLIQTKPETVVAAIRNHVELGENAL